MKLVQTQITPLVNTFLHIEMRDQPYLYSPFHGRPSFHAHPELELTFVVEGYGKRIIGNKVSNYEAGDMVFIGSNVPHIWLSDPVFYKDNSNLRSKVIVTYINLKIFEQMFDLLKEMSGIREMVQQASKGIKIYGETKNIIANRLVELSDKTGFEKVNGLLEIMHIISVSDDRKFIVEKEISAADANNSDRLITVIKYIKENLGSPISLKDVADIACMTMPSFCRFFKHRTKMRFSQYLLEERMEYARKLLIEQDKPISTIASMCGYVSNSHFCKVFKQHAGQSPNQYKSSIDKYRN